MTLEEVIRNAVRDEVRAAVRELTEALRPGPSAPDLMTVAQAVTYAATCETKIREWLRTGKLNRYGDGPRHVRVSRAELDHLLAPKVSDEPTDADLDERARVLALGRR